MNENDLLTLIRQELPIQGPSIIVGSGDDCAVVQSPYRGRELVLKTDATVEGIHFTSQENLTDVGWKALCRAISDFAAMGAIPEHALITVAAPTSWRKEKWIQLSQGFGKAARTFNIVIAGGEITRSPGILFLSVTLTGSTGFQTILRSGAKQGDLICVTGFLGGSLKSRRHLTFTPRLAEGQWLAKQKAVHAMMDLSDGLGSDLPRLAQASQCGFQLEKEKIPCHAECSVEEAISDGEDYELLLTVKPDAWPRLQDAWKKEFPLLALTAIGIITAANEPATPLPKGFDHLNSSNKLAR